MSAGPQGLLLAVPAGAALWYQGAHDEAAARVSPAADVAVQRAEKTVDQ
ncbi:hypothetical protein [Streptomyces fodineus]|nr:hypothetical protein [Streptomyces fodineus]